MTKESKKILLDWARTQIRCRIGRMPPPVCPSRMEKELLEPGAVFVTLTIQGELRGCIGSLTPRKPLWEDVKDNALAAAFADPRPPPLTEAEEQDVHMEISLLNPPEKLMAPTPHEKIGALKPGIHGVILELHGHRSTFLPQVWIQLPSPEIFLAHLSQKAGLASDAWKDPETVLKVYQVVKWGDTEFPGQGPAAATSTT